MDTVRWDELRRKALWMLEHADELAPREPLEGMGAQLRLWSYPVEGPLASWTLLLGRGPVAERRRPLVREVVWDRPRDQERGDLVLPRRRRPAKADPTVTIRDAEVSWDEVSPFMARATALTAPLPEATAGPGREEGRCGIEGYRSMAYLRLEWRGRGPAAWGPAVRWVTRLRRLLARAIQERAGLRRE